MHLVPMGTASECEWKHGGAVFLSNPTVKDAFPGAYRRRSSFLEAYRQRPLDWDRPPHGSGANRGYPLVICVARAMQPGSKVATMLILEALGFERRCPTAPLRSR
jgi:hypothetical protein